MINNIGQILNNREIAIAVWLVVMFFFVSLKLKTFYRSVWGILLASFKIWKMFLLMVCYIATIIFILYKSGFLNESSIKVTIFWFFGWALVMVLNSIRVGREAGYLKKIIIEMIGLTAIISYISNFYCFSLLFELIIIPVMFLLVGIATIAPYDPKNKKVGKCANVAATLITLITIFYSLYITILNFNSFATIDTLRDFLTPIILSLTFIPFMYLLSLYNEWEQKTKMSKILAENNRKRNQQ